MTPERLAEAHRILAECAARPDDPQAQAVARWIRQTLVDEGPALKPEPSP